MGNLVIHQDTIHSLDGEGDEVKDAIRLAEEDEALLNWTSEPIIDICVSKDLESKLQEMNFRSLSIDSIRVLEYDDQGCDDEIDDYEEFEDALQMPTRDLGPDHVTVEIINVRSEEEKRELKVVVNLEQSKMIELFKEYIGSRDCTAQNSSVLRGRT
ncbi:hypothetical protein PIB30_040076 [Stylosanthes scabra]|uniref:Uncharacterized protein n=1 Tax=Stylosanthes scabra TaxID=79078 RepID=A0ABU6XCK3_9FABA|nr:hypothetical protein [Stylosanthes scabra]